MRIKHTMVVRLAVVLLPVLLLAAGLNRGGAPAFSTGAPGEGTCAACHTGNPLNDPSGSLQLGAPAAYVPGETLNVSVRAQRPGAVRFGFQITAKDAAGNPVGTFDVTADNVQLAIGSPNHVTHAPAADSNGEFEWVIPWDAPAAGAGEVTFYAAANTANGDFTNSGDFIYTTNLSLMQGSATDTDQFEDTVPVRFTVGAAYPNPVAVHSRLRIPVEGHVGHQVRVRIFDVAGRLVHAERPQGVSGLERGYSSLQIQSDGLLPGVYMARIEAGGTVQTVPFVVNQ